MSEGKLREEICRFGHSLFERGLTPGSSGNISLRLDDGGWLVTPTNASLGFLDPARIARLNAEGQLIWGTPRPRKSPCIPRSMIRGQGPAPLCICTRPIRWHSPCCPKSIPRQCCRR